MAQQHHRIQRQESGAALDGVKRAKHRIQQLAVARRRFQPDQLLAQALQQFARLDQEILAQLQIECRIHRGPAFKIRIH